MLMMASSVEEWLESLQLEQYLATMEEGGFDTVEKCASITASDLDRIGVTLPGHQLRILKHLPHADGVLQEPSPASDIYDVPTNMNESATARCESVYENVEVKPELPPKRSPPPDRPVPQPRRIHNKKPVPKPRTIRMKSPLIAFDSPERKPPTSSAESILEQKTEQIPEHKRKPSLKLSGVTESDTELDDASSCPNIDAGSSEDSTDGSCDYVPMEGENIKHVGKKVLSGGEEQSEVKLPKKALSDDLLCDRHVDGSVNASDMATNRPSEAAVVLTDKDLDYLEHMHGIGASKSTVLAEDLFRQPNVNNFSAVTCEKDSPESFDAKADNPNNDMFNLKSSFDEEVAIPQSLNEWDAATGRRSLTVDMKSPTDDDGEFVSNVTAASSIGLMQYGDNNNKKSDSAECGSSSDIQAASSEGDHDNAKPTSHEAGLSITALEEEENKLNEALYAKAREVGPTAACGDSFYMSVWNMKSGSDGSQPVSGEHTFPESPHMSPPTFSPPPPPNEVMSKVQMNSGQLNNKSEQSERNLVRPPELPKRNIHAPPIPQRCASNKQQIGTSAHGTKVMPSHTANEMPAINSSGKRDRLPPLPTDLGQYMVQPGAVPGTPNKQTKVLPVLRDKPSVSSVAEAGSRESFTDLALTRIASKHSSPKPMISLPEEASTIQAVPLPPPKPGPNHFQDLCSMANESAEYEDIPASPSVYDDIHSDDTLSDGGDWIDSCNLPSKDVLKHSIPIIPAVQNKNTSKSGYLFKKASEETIRKMGGTWTKRWVTTNEKYLTYCSARKHSVTKRIIPVESILNIEQNVKSAETHPYQFCVITIDRIYTFAADNADDMSVWSNVLMFNIMACKDPFVPGGEMNSPDLEGFVKMENVKNKRYFALKGDKLCYYNTLNDFRAGTPVAQIDLKLSALKDLNRNRLQLVTPTETFVLIMDTPEELSKWKKAFEEAIVESLGEDTVLNEVYENHSNRFCADCQVSGPQWASINMGITLCKQCAGIHRMLTLPVSKVRSLRMDSAVWKPALIKLMQAIGNDNANNFWQWNLKQDDYIDADSTMAAREEHIKLKYRSKHFCKLHPLKGDQSALNEALLKAVQYTDVLETMQLLFTGADILSCGPDGQTPLQLAEKANQELQVEFLCQNGAEGSGQMPVTTSTVQEQMDVSATTFLSHKGYLFKTGSNVKEDFLKRWCVLEDGYLAYYESEKNASPKNKIGVKEMLSVTMTCDPRHEFSFELATIRHGRVFLFAAELEEDRKTWVNILAKSIAPVPKELLTHVRDFTRAGIVYMRKGSSEVWYKSWAQQKERLLFYYNQNLKGFEKIDLRKVKNIKLLSNISETCRDVYEEGPVVVLYLYKDRSRTYNTLYLQGNMIKETDTWHGLLQTLTKKSGLTIEEQPLTDEDIPVIVDECINFVTLHGMKTCGIYRLNGQHSKVTKLLESFQTAKHIHKLLSKTCHTPAVEFLLKSMWSDSPLDAREQVLRQEEYNVHDVATVLKRFIRRLEEPLLLQSLYPKWLNTASIAESGLKLEWYQYLVRELPVVNYCTLKKLILHLCRVADFESENKMNTTNLASIFGPIVMSVDKDGDSGAGFAATSQEIAVFRDLMTDSVQIFEIDDQELELESKMQAARKKMEEVMKKSTEKSKSVSQEMLLPVYIYSKDGRVFTMKVTSSTTAEELLVQVLEKCPLQTSRELAIYECICNEELQRPLHGTEKVLAVILCWAGWPPELCKDNILCVKENRIYENIELVFDPHTALFSELKYSEKKGFKKYCFEFSHMQMSYKKDARSTSPLCSWNVEDITVYLGVQQKRNPPTIWGFSFIKKDEKVQGSLFGHSVCCNTKEELYRWLAALLYAQNIGPPRRTGASPNDDAVHQTDASLSPVEQNSVGSSQRNSRLKNFIFNKLMHK